MPDDNLIQNKYKPSKLSDIIGNTKSIEYIKNWLKSYDDVKGFLKNNGLLKRSSKGRKKKLNNISEMEVEFSKRKGNLLITGPHGCGKSSIINIILKDMNYDVINLNMLDPKIKIDIDLIAKLSVKNNVISDDYSDTESEDSDIMEKIEMDESGNYNIKERKTVLLIDELESVITLNDKVGVFNIIKDNNFNRWMPIIIITNNQHNKQLNETKKYSNEMKIYPPYQSEINKWLQTICKIEKIQLDWDQTNKFIEYCQNDMRKMLIQLDEIKINYGNKKISNIIFEDFMNIMKKKDLDFDLYFATNKILTDYKDVNRCLKLYETEKVLIPLMIHENYHKFIKQEQYTKVLDSLSTGDILENYIYGEQNWDLLEIHGLRSCAIPSYYINKYSNGKKTGNLVFAADLNRTSVKKMNRKNINKTNESINKNSKENIRNKSIDEFIYMSEIINKVSENKSSKTTESNSYINNIIKINKLKSNKK
jgi:replication factor C subunit 1